MNPILNKLIQALSRVVNVSTGISHPVDESRAKELFKALHQIGIVLEKGHIYELAFGDGWPERHAKMLTELGEKGGMGARIRVQYPKNWGEEVIRKRRNNE